MTEFLASFNNHTKLNWQSQKTQKKHCQCDSTAKNSLKNLQTLTRGHIKNENISFCIRKEKRSSQTTSSQTTFGVVFKEASQSTLQLMAFWESSSHTLRLCHAFTIQTTMERFITAQARQGGVKIKTHMHRLSHLKHVMSCFQRH